MNSGNSNDSKILSKDYLSQVRSQLPSNPVLKGVLDLPESKRQSWIEALQKTYQENMFRSLLNKNPDDLFSLWLKKYHLKMVKSLLKEYKVKINDVLQKKTGNELEDLLIAERDRKDKA